MTTMEWLNKQKARINAAAEVATKRAAQETHRQVANRIFNEGKNSNDANIGKYNDTDPIYVNPKNSPKKFTPAGKPGSKDKRAKRATKWFASYRAYRSAIGLPTSPVKLNLFGILQSDFVNSFAGKGLSWASVLKNPENQKKRLGLEKRFGAKIFTASEKEKALFIKLSGEEFAKEMANAK